MNIKEEDIIEYLILNGATKWDDMYIHFGCEYIGDITYLILSKNKICRVVKHNDILFCASDLEKRLYKLKKLIETI